jgi:light-harvesting complex I chlorophyll a/b binding protein 1
MVAALGILVGETANPLFDGKITGPAIYQFQQADDLVSFFWVGVLFFIALIEGQNIITGWESIQQTNARKSGIAVLREEYVNGDLGFDPLGLSPKTQEGFDTMRTKELNNGRLAMIGVAGMVVQELVTGNKIF